MRQLAERLGGAEAVAAIDAAAAAAAAALGVAGGPMALPAEGGGEGGGSGGIDWRRHDPESYGLAAASSYGWSR